MYNIIIIIIYLECDILINDTIINFTFYNIINEKLLIRQISFHNQDLHLHLVGK